MCRICHWLFSPGRACKCEQRSTHSEQYSSGNRRGSNLSFPHFSSFSYLCGLGHSLHVATAQWMASSQLWKLLDPAAYVINHNQSTRTDGL